MTRRSSDPWTPCPAGEFRRLGQRLRARRRHRRVFLYTAARLAAGVALGVGAAAWWLRADAPGETSPSALTCTQVKQLIEPYARGALDDAVRQQVRAHLSGCAACRALYNARGLSRREGGPHDGLA
jgi:hypothetical protein